MRRSLGFSRRGRSGGGGGGGGGLFGELGRQALRGKLRVYAGAEHPHTAQQPKTLTLSTSETK